MTRSVDILIAFVASFLLSAAFAGEVYVDDFGATGDGSTIDSAAFDLARDAAGPGGVIHLTPGKTYNLHDRLALLSSQTLNGNHATVRRADALQATLLSDAVAGSRELFVDNADQYQIGMRISPVDTFRRGENQLLHRIHAIDGNKITFSNPLNRSYAAGDKLVNLFSQVEVRGTTNQPGKVLNVNFDGNRTNNDDYIWWGVNRAVSITSNGYVTDSQFYNLPGDGAGVYGSNVKVSRNAFRDANGSGIHLSGNFSPSGVLLDDNFFTRTNEQADRSGHSEGAITISNQNNYIDVRNNVAIDADTTFISLFHQDMGNWTVENNYVSQLERVFYSGIGAGTLPLRDLDIIGNYAESTDFSLLQKGPGYIERVNFSDNTFVNSPLNFRGLNDSEISNNVVLANTTDPFKLFSMPDTTVIEGNTVASNYVNAGQNATLIYVAESGRVLLDGASSPGGSVTRFMFANGGKQKYSLSGYLPPFADAGNNATVSNFVLAQHDPTGVGLSDVVDLGSILPAHLESADVAQYFEFARYADVDNNFGAFQVYKASVDFDSDGEVGLADLNALMVQGPLTPVTLPAQQVFDLNADGFLDVQDRDIWLRHAAIANGNLPGQTYAMGDLDLDFDVDTTDLGLLLNHFNPSGSSSGWGDGDVTMDGRVDSSDLGHLINSLILTPSTSVPEPKTAFLFLPAVLMCIMERRRQGATVNAKLTSANRIY